MFYVNRMIQHFTARQEIPTAAVPRNDIYGGAVRNGKINIKLKGSIHMDHAMKAAELFMGGYNCAQAVAVAFCDVTGLDEKSAARMVSAFGGGMGRMREVCGAVSGMFFVLSWLYGYDEPIEGGPKKQLYTDVQALAAGFREKCGSIVCREILKNPPSDPAPSPRTAEYYSSRPCARMVFTAGQLMDEFIAQHPLEERHG